MGKKAKKQKLVVCRKPKSLEHLSFQILEAFEWATTKQGERYWADVYDQLQQIYHQAKEESKK